MILNIHPIYNIIYIFHFLFYCFQSFQYVAWFCGLIVAGTYAHTIYKHHKRALSLYAEYSSFLLSRPLIYSTHPHIHHSSLFFFFVLLLCSLFVHSFYVEFGLYIIVTNSMRGSHFYIFSLSRF
jgi:hypothetical protein